MLAKTGIELLTAVKALSEGGTPSSQGFGIILELDQSSLVIESRRERHLGEVLLLCVVFPGVHRDSNPQSTLRCVVAGVRDAATLRYVLRIDEADEVSRERLEAYLKRPATAESA